MDPRMPPEQILPNEILLIIAEKLESSDFLEFAKVSKLYMIAAGEALLRRDPQIKENAKAQRQLLAQWLQHPECITKDSWIYQYITKDHVPAENRALAHACLAVRAIRENDQEQFKDSLYTTAAHSKDRNKLFHYIGLALSRDLGAYELYQQESKLIMTHHEYLLENYQHDRVQEEHWDCTELLDSIQIDHVIELVKKQLESDLNHMIVYNLDSDKTYIPPMLLYIAQLAPHVENVQAGTLIDLMQPFLSERYRPKVTNLACDVLAQLASRADKEQFDKCIKTLESKAIANHLGASRALAQLFHSADKDQKEQINKLINIMWGSYQKNHEMGLNWKFELSTANALIQLAPLLSKQQIEEFITPLTIGLERAQDTEERQLITKNLGLLALHMDGEPFNRIIDVLVENLHEFDGPLTMDIYEENKLICNTLVPFRRHLSEEQAAEFIDPLIGMLFAGGYTLAKETLDHISQLAPKLAPEELNNLFNRLVRVANHFNDDRLNQETSFSTLQALVQLNQHWNDEQQVIVQELRDRIAYEEVISSSDIYQNSSLQDLEREVYDNSLLGKTAQKFLEFFDNDFQDIQKRTAGLIKIAYATADKERLQEIKNYEHTVPAQELLAITSQDLLSEEKWSHLKCREAFERGIEELRDPTKSTRQPPSKLYPAQTTFSKAQTLNPDYFNQLIYSTLFDNIYGLNQAAFDKLIKSPHVKKALDQVASSYVPEYMLATVMLSKEGKHKLSTVNVGALLEKAEKLFQETGDTEQAKHCKELREEFPTPGIVQTLYTSILKPFSK